MESERFPLVRWMAPFGIALFLVIFSLTKSPQISFPSLFEGGLNSSHASLVELSDPFTGYLGFAPKRASLVCEVRAKNTTPAVSPRLNLVLVLDRSGSMRAEGKMKQSLKAAQAFVETLSPEDSLSIVTFSTTAEIVLKSQLVGEGEEARKALSRIRPGGATNLSHALKLAVAQGSVFQSETRITRILVLSDGKSNHGVTEEERLVDLSRQIFEAGISVTTFGLGDSFRETTLTRIAQAGWGNFYYLENAERAKDAFLTELRRIQEIQLRDVRLHLNVQPVSSPAISQAIESLETGPSAKNLEVPLGDLRRGEALWRVLPLSSFRGGLFQVG